MISRNRHNINSNWRFKESKEEAWERVDIPHTNHMVPYNYFDEKDYQLISYYEKEIILPNPQKRYILLLEGVMAAFGLSVDGRFLGEHKGGYLPHRIELPRTETKDQKVTLFLELDSTEQDDIPPFGNVLDYLTYGGIYRDVFLYELNHTFFSDAYLQYEVKQINGDRGTVLLFPSIELDSLHANENLCMTLSVNGKEHSFETSVNAGVNTILFPPFEMVDVSLWSLNAPVLYECVLTLREGDMVLDEADIRLGFRKLETRADGLFLNDEPVNVFGLNRHQSFPYVGYAMPKRVQEQDAVILKRDLGLNTVRTAHYPQSPYFLDKCDELGLLVMEEIPGWQYISAKKEWRDQAVSNVKAMIRRDANHPCIFTWGVRINESGDDHELYQATNQAARALDPSRPTSGSRCIERSELLEDIYTMNDFIHGSNGNHSNILRTRERCTGLEEKVPYLVTECVGHMFPTKRFDQEQRLVEHALMHARIQSRAAQDSQYMGAVGWCAFDYNTHYDFGSGDRICYHGVMDMFRIPKFAAAVYKSQRKPQEGYVLEPLTYWTRGERNGGKVFPIHVFTNCQLIEIKMGGVSKGKMERQFLNTDPDMQYLTYPPFLLEMSNGEWGDCWNEAEFIGYDDGKQVITRRFAANPVYQRLKVEADGYELTAGEMDAVRVVVQAVDQADNMLPYLNEPVLFETEGDVEIMGPKNVSLIGGCTGFWVRTKPGAGKGSAKIMVTGSKGKKEIITIQLI